MWLEALSTNTLPEFVASPMLDAVYFAPTIASAPVLPVSPVLPTPTVSQPRTAPKNP